jgi:hypothetical protein
VSELNPRELVALNVERIVLRARCIQVTFREASVDSAVLEIARDHADALAAIAEGKHPIQVSGAP